jgi:hypothetical protein
VNEIKVSLAFGVALVLIGGWLIRWHRAMWVGQRSEQSTDDRTKHHYQVQFRRRIQVSMLLILLGVMIPFGDWLIELQRKDPGRNAALWLTAFWIGVLFVALWIMLLAVFDWLSTRMHVRATRAALAGLARKQRELEAEVDRLRNMGSNGRK